MQLKPNAELGFLSIDDLVNNQGELALMLEFDSSNQHMCIEACAQLPADATQQNIVAMYISLCSDNLPAFSALYQIPHSNTQQGDATSPTIPIFSLKT